METLSFFGKIASFFGKKKSAKVQETATNVKAISGKEMIKQLQPEVNESKQYFGWTGYTGTNKNKVRHFNKKRHGNSLRKKHHKAA